VSRNKMIVESSAACKVGTRSLPLPDWTAVVQHLAPQFDFAVSPLSFVEVLRSLALGQEQYVIPNLKRVEALAPIDPLHPVFLEMPGQFILREVLGRGPSVEDTYQPSQMAADMVTLLGAQRVTKGVRDWLDKVTSKHQSGVDNFTNNHHLMRKVGQAVPTPENWVQAKFKRLGLSDDEIRRLSAGVDAAYQYAIWVRRELNNPSYLPSNETSAWFDYQQLFYLSDPTIHILYWDNDLMQRSGSSTQRSRLLKLPDVLAEALPTSA
jgi:hypothetical protein